MPQILNTLSDKALPNLLLDGSVGILPTDTVYGLVCAANNAEAVTRVYKLKSREHKPGTIVASSIDQLVALGLKARYLKAVEQYWPGPVTIVIPCGPELNYLDMGLRTLAVRISDNETLNALIDVTGPLLTTSANLPGEKPADTIAEAEKYFGNSVDFYVEGGNLSDREPSTLIRVVDDAVEVLRQGAVKINEETGEIL